MPYQTRDDLPENVKRALQDVPHAQEIYKEAYNSSYEHYDNQKDRQGDATREEAAHAVAWNAVKSKYKKGVDGKWHPK